MTPEEYQWHINLVKDRYNTLNLTVEQAEKIYAYEQDEDSYSDKDYFSAWEGWDYELTIFRGILTDEQFGKYEASLKEAMQRYEQNLIEEDARKSKEIGYYQELIDYYETQFLPDFFNDPFTYFGWILEDKNKVKYLRTEYKCFLADKKKEILINHFRHYRTFKPNELKVTLARHKISAILPDFPAFKHQMDEPTKAVATYLTTKADYLPAETEQLLANKFNELKTFSEQHFKKHYGEPKGWHIVIGPLSDEKENERRLMTLLLLDKEKYGY